MPQQRRLIRDQPAADPGDGQTTGLGPIENPLLRHVGETQMDQEVADRPRPDEDLAGVGIVTVRAVLTHDEPLGISVDTSSARS
jgi:hypothetical protein